MNPTPPRYLLLGQLSPTPTDALDAYNRCLSLLSSLSAPDHHLACLAHTSIAELYMTDLCMEEEVSQWCVCVPCALRQFHRSGNTFGEEGELGILVLPAMDISDQKLSLLLPAPLPFLTSPPSPPLRLTSLPAGRRPVRETRGVGRRRRGQPLGRVRRVTGSGVDEALPVETGRCREGHGEGLGRDGGWVLSSGRLRRTVQEGDSGEGGGQARGRDGVRAESAGGERGWVVGGRASW